MVGRRHLFKFLPWFGALAAAQGLQEDPKATIVTSGDLVLSNTTIKTRKALIKIACYECGSLMMSGDKNSAEETMCMLRTCKNFGLKLKAPVAFLEEYQGYTKDR